MNTEQIEFRPPLERCRVFCVHHTGVEHRSAVFPQVCRVQAEALLLIALTSHRTLPCGFLPVLAQCQALGPLCVSPDGCSAQPFVLLTGSVLFTSAEIPSPLGRPPQMAHCWVLVTISLCFTFRALGWVSQCITVPLIRGLTPRKAGKYAPPCTGLCLQTADSTWHL